MMFGAKQFNKLGDPFLFGIVIYSNNCTLHFICIKRCIKSLFHYVNDFLYNILYIYIILYINITHGQYCLVTFSIKIT